MTSSIVGTPKAFKMLLWWECLLIPITLFIVFPCRVFSCLMSLSERSIDSMPYARIGQPMVFQRNAFTSELRPGYDIPNEANLNIPCRHFLDLFFVWSMELSWELKETPSIFVSFERCIVESPRVHTGGVVCGCLPIQIILVFVGLNFILHVCANWWHMFIRLWSPVAVVLTRLRSSAYANIFRWKSYILTPVSIDLSLVSRSLMNLLNIWGDSMLPCFIPFVILKLLLSLLSHLTCTYELLYQLYRNSHWTSGMMLISL